MIFKTVPKKPKSVDVGRLIEATMKNMPTPEIKNEVEVKVEPAAVTVSPPPPVQVKPEINIEVPEYRPLGWLFEIGRDHLGRIDWVRAVPNDGKPIGPKTLKYKDM